MKLESYFKNFFYSGILLSIVCIVFIFYISNYHLIPSFENISKKIIFTKYKNILINHHNSIQNFIQFNQIILLKTLKQQLKEEVHLGYNVAYYTFEEHLNEENVNKIKNGIITILKHISFSHNKRKFFVIDLNGNVILYPIDPKKEGENILNLQDATGDYFVKKIIKIALLKKEGFYIYVKKRNVKKLPQIYEKILYFKLFEPYNWIIGIGEWYNDFLYKYKKEILKRLRLFSFSQNFGFAIIENGKPLLKKNVYKFKIPERNNGIIDTKSYLFYITYLPELNWKIISILNKNQVQNEILIINKRIKNIVNIIILFIIIFFTLIFSGLFFTFYKLQKSITIEIDKFKKFFKRIPENFIKMPREKFKFFEFKELADYSNEMSDILKKTFLNLEQEKKYLEIITENSSIGFIILNQNMEIEYCNNEFKKMLNLNSGNNIGPIYNFIKIKSCKGKFKFNSKDCIIYNAFKNQKSFISENETIITYYGKEIPVLFIINPIIEKNYGDKIVLIIKDMTDERKIKNELLKLKRAIEQAPVSIVITDINGIIEYVNPFFCKITGYTKEEAIGNTPGILKTEFNKKFYKDLWDTISSGKIWEGEFLNCKKNGETYWEKAIISPVFNKNGIITNFVAVKQDVTEIKNLQKKLIKAKEEAELANKSKSEFLANMSHEIRTPMNAIWGFIDLLYQTSLNETQKKYLDIIKSSSENLLKILNDILDLSKLESGNIEFEKINFNIHRIIIQCINIFSKKAEEKGISLKYKIDENVPEYLIGDPTRISQVINNLLSNAIKFTENGEVGIKVNLKNMYKSEAELLIIVYDTGIGIEQDKLNKIFDPFSQADSSITRRYGGTGLGLTIVKKIINYYNGKIWVESKIGKGTKFFFTLLLKTGTEEDIEKLTKKSDDKIVNFSGVKVLVAEDNLTNQILIKEILKKFNIEVEIANNGVEALKKLGNQNYDLIFLDWHMPEMDGIETVKILRKIEKNEVIIDKRIDKTLISKLKNRKFTIIALTAAVMDSDKEFLSKAGFNEFLSKPIIIEDLIEILKKYLKHSKYKEVIKEDLSLLRNFVNNDEDLMKTLIDSFKESLEKNIEIIKESLEKNDFEKIKFSAHSIKGTAFNIKLNKIGLIAEKIEKEAKNKNKNKIIELLKALEKIEI